MLLAQLAPIPLYRCPSTHSHSRTVPRTQAMEATPVSLSSCTDKQTVVCTHEGKSALKGEEILAHATTRVVYGVSK